MRIRLFHLLFFMVFLAGSKEARSATDKESKVKASVHFQKAEYEQALLIWREMSAYTASVGLYHNIGLAESRSGNVAEAIYAYEQGLRLKPGNRELQQLLARERDKIPDATIPVESFFLTRAYSNFITLVRPGIWFLFGFVLIAFSAWLWWRCMRSTAGVHRFFPGWRSTIGIIGFILCVIGMASHRYIYRENEGVIMEECELRQAPDTDSPSMRSLYPGEKVQLSDRLSDWHRVTLLNYDVGWIHEDVFQVIRIP